MSSADNISTLITIIFGLMLTDLFASMHRLIRNRRRVRWHWLPLLTSWYVLTMVLKNWWGLVFSEGHDIWAFARLDTVRTDQERTSGMNIATTLRATAAAVILIALAAANPGLAQHDREHEHHDHDAHQDAHGHDAGGPELGMTAAWVRLVDEEEDALGVHAHLTKRLAGEGSWALVTAGVGGEVIFAEARHYVASVVVGVNPWRALTLSVAPGIQWAKHEHEDEVEYETGFVAHLEATWAFAVGSGDIGPTIGWSRAGDEQHWGFGIHFGIHF